MLLDEFELEVFPCGNELLGKTEAEVLDKVVVNEGVSGDGEADVDIGVDGRVVDDVTATIAVEMELEGGAEIVLCPTEIGVLSRRSRLAMTRSDNSA